MNNGTLGTIETEPASADPLSYVGVGLEQLIAPFQQACYGNVQVGQFAEEQPPGIVALHIADVALRGAMDMVATGELSSVAHTNLELGLKLRDITKKLENEDLDEFTTQALERMKATKSILKSAASGGESNKRLLLRSDGGSCAKVLCTLVDIYEEAKESDSKFAGIIPADLTKQVHGVESERVLKILWRLGRAGFISDAEVNKKGRFPTYTGELVTTAIFPIRGITGSDTEEVNEIMLLARAYAAQYSANHDAQE